MRRRRRLKQWLKIRIVKRIQSIKVILGFLCFHFWLFLLSLFLSNCNFGMHTMPLCSCLYTNPYLSLYSALRALCAVCVCIRGAWECCWAKCAVKRNVYIVLRSEFKFSSISVDYILAHRSTHASQTCPNSQAYTNANTPRRNNNKAQAYASWISMFSVCYFFSITQMRLSKKSLDRNK